MATRTRCRTLVAGFGRPGMRDLDFGRQFVRYLEGTEWPEGVLVEDLSYAAPLVLDRLRELEPAKLVLVGAVARGLDPPGVLRRHGLPDGSPSPEDVQRSLEESLQGLVDIDHTLAIARHWGGLPADTVVIEVEPADCSFGVGFSEQMASVFDPLLAMLLDELGEDMGTQPPTTSVEDALTATAEPTEDLMALVEQAGADREARQVHSRRGGPPLPASINGLSIAGRYRPWGLNLQSGSDWIDAMALDDGWVGVVVGRVPGRGADAAPAMADLRAAVRAYAILAGSAPAELLTRLDRLAQVVGIGEGACVAYVAVRPATGELRVCTAGNCPPLLAEGGQVARSLGDGLAGPLGAESTPRAETRSTIGAGTTVLLFTGGLPGAMGDPASGLESFGLAADVGNGALEEVCDHLFAACDRGVRRDADLALLAVRLGDPGGR